VNRLAGVRGEIPLDEAEGVAEMMVATGRAIPAGKWVDVLVDHVERSSMEGLF
jgi:hypothetical protein